MTMSMSMIPFLHFGNTDYLIFKAWRPSSHGAIVGACIGLFVFCILERCLAAYRRILESHWRTRACQTCSVPACAKDGAGASRDSSLSSARKRLFPPFTPSRDFSRGLIEAIRSTFSYVLMLAVMTFNGAYILSIIIGIGVGEVLFGRIGRNQDAEVH